MIHQLAKGYFKPRGEGIMLLVCSYLHFLCLFKRFFLVCSLIEYKLFLNWSVCSIIKILTNTIASGQRGSGSNCNEKIVHTIQISKSETSPSDVAYCHTKTPNFKRVSWEGNRWELMKELSDLAKNIWTILLVKV